LAHDRAADDLHREIEIGNQAPHHLELLIILLAEVGSLRTDDRQELGHDRRHAAKVPRPVLALPAPGRPTHLDPRGEAGWVHRLWRRVEDEIDTGITRQLEVALDRPRVPSEVLLRPE